MYELPHDESTQTAAGALSEALARIAELQRTVASKSQRIEEQGRNLAHRQKVLDEARAELVRLRTAGRRRVTTVMELDALPDRTIIRNAHGTAVQKTDGVWEHPNAVGQLVGEAVDLPATVLWEPEGSTTR